MKLARKANKAGLTNYDLKSPLSVGQKSYLTKLTKDSNPLKQVLNNPKGFAILDAPARLVKNAKQAGVIASNGKLFVRNKILNGKPSFKNMKVTKFGIAYDEQLQNVTRHFDIFYPGTEGFFKLSKELEKGIHPLGKNSYVTFKIGGNSPFRNVFSDYATLYNYIDEMVAGNVFTNDFGKLLPEISFVTIKRPKNATPKKGNATNSSRRRGN